MCELCTSRALHGGWVREGTVPDDDERGARIDRRRSLLSRLRGWRDAVAVGDDGAEFDDDLEASSNGDDGYPVHDGGRQSAPARDSRPSRDSRAGREARPRDTRPGREPRAPREPRAGREPRPVREPRHVRAVPTSTEHKVSSAVELFNASEHPRTVAGIARSLGLPGAAW